MQTYSIRYLDRGGRNERSEFLTLSDNPAAVAYGRIGLLKNHIVEVWRGDNLVTRLYRDQPAAGPPAASVLLVQEIAPHPSSAPDVADWESEGGAPAQQPAVVEPKLSHPHLIVAR